MQAEQKTTEQASKREASRQARKDAIRGKQAGQHASKQASKQASKHERRKASQNPQLVAGAELGHDCSGYECFVFVFLLTSYNCRENPNSNLPTWKSLLACPQRAWM